MAEEDTPLENTDKPKFGLRARREKPGKTAKPKSAKPSTPASPAAASEAVKKPRVRIGPKNRRTEVAPDPEPAQPAVQPVVPAPPRQDRQPRPKSPQPAPRREGQDRKPQQQSGQQIGMNFSEQGSGGIRRKRRRRKVRRPDDGQQRPQNGEADVPQKPASQRNDLPACYVPGQVLPPVVDDYDEVPSGIYETDDLTDSDADSSSSDGDSYYDSEADSPLSEGSVGQISEADSCVNSSDASSHPETRSSRDRKRRKKRRDRHEPPQVDRSSGYWWAEQWVRSFEMLFPSNASRARLAKGRTYARRGQVLELEVGPNGVLARVQGSRPRPYQVRLELNRLRRETWGRILHQLVGKATFLAQLLEGHLPPEIEEVFFSAGARLFPHGDVDVRTRCNCPDPVAPCKHVAALNYALAEALQRDPFLLFAMRGKSRDQFLQDLREMRGRDRTNAPPPPSDEDLTQFWRMGRLTESVLKPTGWSMSNDPARLLQSLGEPQLEGIREGLFLPMLEATYRQVAESMRRLPKDA